MWNALGLPSRLLHDLFDRLITADDEGDSSGSDKHTECSTTSSSSSACDSDSPVLPETSTQTPPPAHHEIGHPAPTQVPAPALLSSMDPLVRAMWKNQVQSDLHRLPERVLAQIIGELSTSGIECLRRTARLFPPLCAREIVSRPRTMPSGKVDYLPEWPNFASMRRLGQGGELLRQAEGRATVCLF